MKKLLLAALAATASFTMAPAANAVVIGAAGQLNAPFATLSTAGLNGGTLATLTGGSVLTSDQPFADIPEGIFGGTFLAAGPTPGAVATLTFNQAINAFGFLIGSPDSYNVLTITSTTGTYTFTPSSLGLATNGDQNLSQYVNFFANGTNERILSASFTNNPAINAFETANFAVSAVPEPAAWAMMILGAGLVGGAMRRRAVRTTVTYA